MKQLLSGLLILDSMKNPESEPGMTSQLVGQVRL